MARSKGLPTWHLLVRHALRPSSLSLLTVFGINFGALIGGSVIVEYFFAIPGVGQSGHRVDLAARLPRRPGRGARGGHRVRRHQLRRRPPLLGARSAGRRAAARVNLPPPSPSPSSPRPASARPPASAHGRGLGLTGWLRAWRGSSLESARRRCWRRGYLLDEPAGSPTLRDATEQTRSPGTGGHLLGTDKNGFDIFSRLLWGGRGVARGRSWACWSSAWSIGGSDRADRRLRRRAGPRRCSWASSTSSSPSRPCSCSSPRVAFLGAGLPERRHRHLARSRSRRSARIARATTISLRRARLRARRPGVGRHEPAHPRPRDPPQRGAAAARIRPPPPGDRHRGRGSSLAFLGLTSAGHDQLGAG